MRKFYLTILAALMLCNIAAAHHKGEEWKERMMNEKIAFFTMELDLSSEEAQIFWPVYNELNKEKEALMKEVFKAFNNLEDAVEADKSEKEISKLLDIYIDALEKQSGEKKKADEKLRKVLSTEKVAKLYIAEEKFRRQHIRKLHKGPEDKNPEKK